MLFDSLRFYLFLVWLIVSNESLGCWLFLVLWCCLTAWGLTCSWYDTASSNSLGCSLFLVLWCCLTAWGLTAWVVFSFDYYGLIPLPVSWLSWQHRVIFFSPLTTSDYRRFWSHDVTWQPGWYMQCRAPRFGFLLSRESEGFVVWYCVVVRQITLGFWRLLVLATIIMGTLIA